MLRLSRRRLLQLAASGSAALAAGGPRSGECDEPLPNLKFAICNETFRDWPDERSFAFAAECGYRGIEIAPFTIANDVRQVTTAQRTRIRRLAEKHGLEICGLHWLLAKTKGLHLTSPDPSIRRATAEYLAALTRFCSDLGGQVMIFGSPQQRNLPDGVDREQGMGYASEVFEAVLPTLEQARVTLALEPLGPGTTDFLVFARDAVQLAKRIDSPWIKIMLDCKAAAKESQPIPQLIDTYRDWFVHFHANDPNLRGPGMGELDFVPIFTALRAIRFKGWVSVEVFDNTPGPEALARESIDYMQRVWRKVAS